MGTFTNEKRWNDANITPGVGDYDLTRFKNIAKANETNFEIGWTKLKKTNIRKINEEILLWMALFENFKS